MVWGAQGLKMLHLGIMTQAPSLSPLPRTGPSLNSENLTGFSLLCGPPAGAPATHHVRHFEASERENDGVGRGGHRQHEGQGGGQSAGEHDIERVEADSLSLEG